MYIPTHFEESRAELLHQLMAQHPLGLLVTTGSDGLDANHLPFDLRSHEAGQPVPWKMADAPRDYLDDMLQQIVGLEITITRLQGKAKLSQNKEARDIAGAANALGPHPLGQAMRAALSGEIQASTGQPRSRFNSPPPSSGQ